MQRQQTLLTLKAEPTLAQVRSLRHQLERACNATVPQEELRQRILLSASEAMNNLLLHASPAPSQLQLDFGRNGSDWWLELRDDAEPFDICAGDVQSIPDFSLEESGRGIILINTLADACDYRAGGDGDRNRLQLRWSQQATDHRPCVLVVDDEPSQLRLYSAYLGQTYRVLAATDGPAALEILETDKVDLVLSDIRMPGMSGLDLRSQLEQRQETAVIPFIFLSGSREEQIRQEACALGIDDYLAKPVTKAALLEACQRVLKRTRQLVAHVSERIEHDISAALAPQLPAAIPGWRVAMARRHTGQGGGDFLLHHEHAGETSVVLADVMGHNDSAKFFSYAYAGYLRGLMQADGGGTSPERMLTQLSDRAMADELLSRITLTACAARLAPDNTITLAAAGHPPPLLMDEHGAYMMAVGGILPGIIDDPEYDERSLQLLPGQRIALYTDGLFESAADDSGRERLESGMLDALAASTGMDIDDALTSCMARFDELSHPQALDDTLLLLLEPAY